MADSGKHKIFLGYAPGVGKTFAMLDEALRRKSRGQEILIGLVESHGRGPVEDMRVQFDSIPSKKITVGDRVFEELDLAATIARHPDLVLVDDLAHTNAPGSERESRWQDVEALLKAGINVISTLNVAHLESLNDHISDITGVKVEHTVPDKVLLEADEVELVDLTPRALLNRLERGDVDAGALYSEGTLAALREIAMREAARHVDEDVIEYRKEKRIEKPWATKDRILIGLTPTKSSLRLIRRGWRIGQRLHAEVEAVYVEEGRVGEREQKILKDDFVLCERLGIKTITLKGNPADQIIKYVREHNITQFIMGHSERTKVQEMLRASLLTELARTLKMVDIIVVATEVDPPAESH
ncbi:MAG: sensor histidine kinase KdpD [Fimbriimonas sp.]